MIKLCCCGVADKRFDLQLGFLQIYAIIGQALITRGFGPDWENLQQHNVCIFYTCVVDLAMTQGTRTIAKCWTLSKCVMKFVDNLFIKLNMFSLKSSPTNTLSLFFCKWQSRNATTKMWVKFSPEVGS